MKQGVMVDGSLGEPKKTTGTKMQYAKTKNILHEKQLMHQMKLFCKCYER